MAGSIDDWYVNASGRHGGRLGHDLDNDDPIDRGVDTWLDDFRAPRTPESRRAPRAMAPQQDVLRSVDDRTPGGGRTAVWRKTDGIARAELAQAARALRARHPGITTKALTKRLRQQLSWPSLTPDHVTEALGRKPPVGLAQEARAIMAAYPGIGPKKLAARLRQRGWADVTPESVRAALQRDRVSKSGVPAHPSAKPAMSASAMARRIRSIDASAPGWTIPALTKAIRGHGWPQATEADVRKSLLGSNDLQPKQDMAPSKRPATTAATTPRAKTGKLGRQQPAARGRSPAISKPTRLNRPDTDRNVRIRAIVSGMRSGSRPDPASLHAAILVLVQIAPRADVRTIQTFLHLCGWTGLTLTHVDALVKEFSVRPSLNSLLVLTAVEHRRATRVAAVSAIRAVLPRETSETIASRLRGWGWPSVTTPQVRDILGWTRVPAQSRRRTGEAAANSQKTLRTTPRTDQSPAVPPNMIGPRRTLDIVERPNPGTCPGCGRVISSLGICGCS
jgi:hypothetical protein